MAEQSGADPRIHPCAKCGVIPEVSWECSDPPRVIHGDATCEAMQKVSKAIESWNDKQRETRRKLEAASDLPF